MTDRFGLSTPSTDHLEGDPVLAMAAAWRRDAGVLRHQVDEVSILAHDLAAYHRSDVWQGAVATRFGDELEQWRTRLSRDRDVGLGAGLLDLADRLDARALAAEQSASGALPGLPGLGAMPPTGR